MSKLEEKAQNYNDYQARNPYNASSRLPGFSRRIHVWPGPWRVSLALRTSAPGEVRRGERSGERSGFGETEGSLPTPRNGSLRPVPKHPSMPLLCPSVLLAAGRRCCMCRCPSSSWRWIRPGTRWRNALELGADLIRRWAIRKQR